MTNKQSLYSIIQFRPDEARAEGVNVGVVVVCPSKNVVKAAFSSNNEAVKRRFRKKAFDDGRLSSAKRALENRLAGLNPDEAALRAFMAQEAGSLVLLEPRPVAIVDLEADLVTLFDDLVGELEPERRTRRPAPPNLGKYFDSLLTRDIPIERDARVGLPGLPEELHFPYAFKNCAHNFIKPQGFSFDIDEAVKEAKVLGADGHLLSKHPEGDQKRRLIVVGAVKNTVIVPTLVTLLADFEARLVTEPEIQDFVEEIRRTAHR